MKMWIVGISRKENVCKNPPINYGFGYSHVNFQFDPLSLKFFNGSNQPFLLKLIFYLLNICIFSSLSSRQIEVWAQREAGDIGVVRVWVGSSTTFKFSKFPNSPVSNSVTYWGFTLFLSNLLYFLFLFYDFHSLFCVPHRYNLLCCFSTQLSFPLIYIIPFHKLKMKLYSSLLLVTWCYFFLVLFAIENGRACPLAPMSG